MGLAIVKGIVEAHGGRIGVETTPGGGATFVFRLPVSREPALPDDADAPAARA
jgi:signal transduction histidine kinase